MSPGEGSQVYQALLGRCHVIADRWYQAIARTGYVPLSEAQVREQLVTLTEEAIALLFTEPFEQSRAEAIGVSLAGLYCIQPKALGRTQEVLAQQFVEGLSAEQVVALQPRLAALLGGLAAGFLQQAREVTLAEQERIRDVLITERVRAEEALQESEERYRDLVEHSFDLIYTHDLQGRLLSVNTAAEKISGYTAEQLVGTNLRDYLAPDARDQFDDYLAEIEREGKASGLMRVVTGSGEQRIWEYHNSLRVEGVRAPIVRGTARDITERKRAEERVRRFLDQQTAVSQLALALGKPRDLDTIYYTIYEHVEALMDAEAFIVSLYDKGTQLIQAEYVVAEGTVLDAASLPSIPLEEDGHGAQSQVIRTGKPLYTPDLRKVMERTKTEYSILEDGTVIEGPPPPGEEAIPRSALYVPLKVEGETVGVMQVQSYRLDAYSQQDMDLLSALASQASIAIHNARLYEGTKRRAEEMTALHRIGLITTSTLNLNEVLKLIYEQVSQLMKPDAFYVALYDEQEEEIRFEIFIEKGESLGKFSRRLEEGGLTGWIIRSAQPLLIRNLAEESPPIEPMVVGEFAPETSYLAVPLMAWGKVMGVISVQGLQPYIFDEDDQRILTAIANQAAIAIENARLYEVAQQEITERVRAEEEIRQRNRELAALNAITATMMQSALNLKEVLQLTADGVVQGLGCNTGLIFLLDEKEGVFKGSAVSTRGKILERIHAIIGSPLVQIKFPARSDFNETASRAWDGRMTIKHDLHDLVSPVLSKQVCSALQRLLGSRTFLVLPLLARGKVVGGIFASTTQEELNKGDTETIMTFANQAAIAIENARLYEAAQQEITERKRAEEKLRRLKEFNEGIVQSMAEGIVLEDVEGYFTFVNQATAAMLGYSPEKLQGQHWTVIVPPDQQPIIQAANERRMRGEADRYELELVRRDGTRVPVLVSGSPRFERGRFAGTLAVFADITERVRMEEALRALLLVDELTGLYNRRGFFTLGQQQLKTADRTQSRMSLLFADFDGLKQINDTFGHPEGDRALMEVADVFRETFRKSDIMARIGGDEFVVLAMETDMASPEVLATRLQENLEARNAKGDRPYKLSLSVGVARYDPEHSCSIDDLLIQADRAMYERKESDQES